MCQQKERKGFKKMKITIKNKYYGWVHEFNSKKEFCDFIENRYYNSDNFIQYYDKRLSVSDLYYYILKGDYDEISVKRAEKTE